MKFIIIKSNIKDGLSIVERAVTENQNLPILRNILIEADNNKIKITATNLEIAINCFIPGKVIENGKITAPASTLLGIINNLQSERLNFESKNNNLIIKTDNYEANIQSLPTSEFPITPKIKDTSEYIELKEVVLKNALEEVFIAGEFSDLRPELNSILFDYLVDSVKIVATDSFRLSEKTIKKDQFKSNRENKFKITIPLKTASELIKILKKEDVVRIYHDDNQVLFQAPNFSILSRLNEGNFPEYGAIVPKKFGLEITLDRQEFLNALKLTSVFGYKNSEVKIKISDNKKSLEISSADQAVGENKYLLPARINGKGGEIVFNWHYLSEVLKILNSSEVFFGINDENEPALLRPVGDDSYFYILKPIISA